MTSIEQIEVALELCARRPDRMNFSALKVMIAAALADARREGAEEMRQTLPEALRKKFNTLPKYSFHLRDGGVRRVVDSCGNWVEHSSAHELFDPEAIRALPLPTGSRQAVLLTDSDIVREICLIGAGPHTAVNRMKNFARAIESAVLAANNLGAHRG